MSNPDPLHEPAPFAESYQSYRAAGWVSPLRLAAGTKFPPPVGYTGYDAEIPSPAKLAEWATEGGNIALHLRGNVIALDVDDHDHDTGEFHGEGSELLAAMEGMFGELPPTYRSSRQDGARCGHLFFRLPSGVSSDGMRDPHGKIEVLRQGHRFSVVSPSVAGGKTYRWYGPDGVELTDGEVPRRADLPELPMAWCVGLGYSPEDSSGEGARRGKTTGAARKADKGAAKLKGELARLLAVEPPRTITAGPGAFAVHPGAQSPEKSAQTILAARQTYLDDPDHDTGLWALACAYGRRLGPEPRVDAAAAMADIRAAVDEAREPGHLASCALCERQIRKGLIEGLSSPVQLAIGRLHVVGSGEVGPVEDVAAITTGGYPQAIPDEWWTKRTMLNRLKICALAGQTSPEAALVAAILRVLGNVGPHLGLPRAGKGGAGRKSVSSLNLLGCVVAPPGTGKDECVDVAEEAFEIKMDPLAGHSEPKKGGIGSGEGIGAKYVRFAQRDPSAKPPQAFELAQTAYAFRAFIGESDTMEKLAARGGNTLLPEIRKAAMGQALGFENADFKKCFPVAAGTYRYVALVLAQPTKIGWLLEDEEGGTPQRFLFAFGGNMTAPDPDQVPDWPEGEWPVTLHNGALMGSATYGTPRFPPGLWVPHKAMALCPAATEASLLNRSRGQRIENDSDEAHSFLTRLKVAAALALMEGRVEIWCEDWEMSEAVMTHSRSTREWIGRVLKEKAERTSRTAGAARGHQDHAAKVTLATAEEDAAEKACTRMAKVLADNDGTLLWSELAQKMGTAYTATRDRALELLEERGRVDVEHFTTMRNNRGAQTGRRITLLAA